MSKKRGLGHDPLSQQKGKKSKSKEAKTERLPDKKNFYLKDGRVYQKVTVSLPWNLTKDLKKKAIDQGKSLSGLIEDWIKQKK